MTKVFLLVNYGPDYSSEILAAYATRERAERVVAKAQARLDRIPPAPFWRDDPEAFRRWDREHNTGVRHTLLDWADARIEEHEVLR